MSDTDLQTALAEIANLVRTLEAQRAENEKLRKELAEMKGKK